MRRTSLLLALLLAACGQPEPAPDRVVGVIETIEGDIASFTVAEQDGDRYEIVIASDVDYGFDLQHLREHETTGDPVDVRLEQRGADLVALSIEDA